MTKLKSVQFVHTVSFGGQISSFSPVPVGDRPGVKGGTATLDDDARFIRLERENGGVKEVRFVPMTNVASFAEMDEPKKVEPKK